MLKEYVSFFKETMQFGQEVKFVAVELDFEVQC